MVVLSNRRLGPAAELLVPADVAALLLRAIARAAAAAAQARWEQELAAWLEQRATDPGRGLDVAEIAWTPDHFAHQRGFVISAIAAAVVADEHLATLGRLQAMIELHPRESVVVGRRWAWVRPASVSA
jgi:hypothetical protein